MDKVIVSSDTIREIMNMGETFFGPQFRVLFSAKRVDSPVVRAMILGPGILIEVSILLSGHCLAWVKGSKEHFFSGDLPKSVLDKESLRDFMRKKMVEALTTDPLSSYVEEE